MAERVALLVATYDYTDPGLRRLVAPAHDAEALAAVLRDPAIGGYEVTTLVNEPSHRVGEAIGDFYRDRRRDDLTLLYVTGHGLKDDSGRLYLAMANTRRDSLLFTALPAEAVEQSMSGSASRQQVLILDCCYSGAFPAGTLTKGDPEVHTLERFQGRGRTVLTASDATQYAFEGGALSGEAARSVFTRHLVAGMRDGSADLDGDGDITLDELYSYVHERVVAEQPHQRPKKQDNVEGRTVIARNVHWELPPYLRNALASPIAADRLAALDGLDHLRRIGNPAVRDRARAEIERLTDDDSRSVATAAQTRLDQPTAPRTPPAPEPPPAPLPESRPVPLPEPLPVPLPESRPEPSAESPPKPPPDREPPPDRKPVGGPGEPAWWRRRRIVVPVVILLAAAVAAAVALPLLAGGSGGSDNASSGSSAAGRPPQYGLALGPDQALTVGTGGAYFTRVDLATGTAAVTDFDVPGYPAGLSYGSGKLFVAGAEGYDRIGAYDVATSVREWGVEVPGGYAVDVAAAPNGKALYVSQTGPAAVLVIDPADHQIVHQITGVGADPDGIAVSRDGRYCYVVSYTDHSIAKISTATNQVVKRVSTPAGHPVDVAVSRDGRDVFVSLSSSAAVAELDANSLEVVTGIAMKYGGSNHAPGSLALNATGSRLYIAVDNGSKILTADTATRQLSGNPVAVPSR